MIGEFRGIGSIGDKMKVSGSLEAVEETETGRVGHYRVVVGTGELKPQEEFVWPTRLPTIGSHP